MDHGKSIDEPAGYLRLAVPLMSKYEIPTTPRNYSTWYMYVSGGDAELTKTIDEMLRTGEKFTEKKNEELYLRFCAEKDENELRRVRARPEAGLADHSRRGHRSCRPDGRI